MLLLTVIMVVQLCICGKIGVNQMDVWTMQNVYTAITDPKKFPTWQSTGAFPQHYKQSLFIKRFQVPFTTRLEMVFLCPAWDTSAINQ